MVIFSLLVLKFFLNNSDILCRLCLLNSANQIDSINNSNDLETWRICSKFSRCRPFSAHHFGSSFSHQTWIGFNIFRRWWFYLASQAASSASSAFEFYTQFDFDIVPGSGCQRGLIRMRWPGAKDQTSGKRRLLAGRFTCQNFPTFSTWLPAGYCAIKMHKHKQEQSTNL